MQMMTTAGGEIVDLDTFNGCYVYIGSHLIKHGVDSGVLSCLEKMSAERDRLCAELAVAEAKLSGEL